MALYPLSRLRAKDADNQRLTQAGTASAVHVTVIAALGHGSHTMVAAAAREACPAPRH